MILATILFHSCGKIDNSLHIRELIPVSEGRTETPNWFLSPQSVLYLSWMEHQRDGGVSLRFRSWADSAWTETRTVASGQDWFVNWADYPALSVFPGSEYNLLAHFLQKRPGGKTYDYDVKLALSVDQGAHFKVFEGLHDTVPAEHGFVTLLPFSFDKILVTWLDGSQMNPGVDEPGHEGHMGHEGAMNLRAALVSVSGEISHNEVIDDRVCECCQTDAAMTGRGPVIIYRNRNEQEERDIYSVRYVSGQWTTPQPVFEDHWKIGGCPVNGPTICSRGNQLAIAWYTEAGGRPAVKAIFSNNAGETYGQPVEIPSANTSGRVDIAWIDAGRVAVSQLEKTDEINQGDALIKLTILSPDGQVLSDHRLAETSSIRKSGFPVIESKDSTLYLAYTQVLDSVNTRVIVKEIILP